MSHAPPIRRLFVSSAALACLAVCAADAAASCGSYVTIGNPVPGVGEKMEHNRGDATSEPKLENALGRSAPGTKASDETSHAATTTPRASIPDGSRCHGPLCQWQPLPLAPHPAPEQLASTSQLDAASLGVACEPDLFAGSFFLRLALLYDFVTPAPPAPPPRGLA